MQHTAFTALPLKDKFNALVEMGKFTKELMANLQEAVDQQDLRDMAIQYNYIETPESFSAATVGIDSGLRTDADYIRAISQMFENLVKIDRNIGLTSELYDGDLGDVCPENADVDLLKDTASAVNMPNTLKVLPK